MKIRKLSLCTWLMICSPDGSHANNTFNSNRLVFGCPINRCGCVGCTHADLSLQLLSQSYLQVLGHTSFCKDAFAWIKLIVNVPFHPISLP